MLVNQQCRVKICDFGLARSLNYVYEDVQHPALTEYVGKCLAIKYESMREFHPSSNKMVPCTGNSSRFIEVGFEKIRDSTDEFVPL